MRDLKVNHKIDLTTKQLRAWIMDRFDSDGYDKEKYPNLAAIFEAEYGWYAAHHMCSQQEAVKQWLLGLPTCFDLPFTYYDIGMTLASWCGVDARPSDLTVMGINDELFDNELQDKMYWERIAFNVSAIIRQQRREC